MSKSTVLLNEWLLVDSDGNKTKIIDVQGAEHGHDSLVIFTQNAQNKSDGIKNKVRIYFEEVPA